MKRHNFKGAGTVGHGTHEAKRHGGSIGMNMTPGRTLKGQKMPGQYGNTKIKVRNLRVVSADPEKNLLVVKGAVPGPNGGYLVIQESL